MALRWLGESHPPWVSRGRGAGVDEGVGLRCRRHVAEAYAPSGEALMLRHGRPDGDADGLTLRRQSLCDG
eukprot:scaffold126763_cov63-Phaeocystis_antarctica.AAC.1